MAKRKSKNFWDDGKMYPLIIQYRSLWSITDDKQTELLVPPQVRDSVWGQIHPELKKICYAVASKLNTSLNNEDAIQSCIAHLHHVLLFNWGEERKKSYAYFYTCARGFFVEYLKGTGRGKMNGMLGKKRLVRKDVLIDRDEKNKKEVLEKLNENETYPWEFGYIKQRRKKDQLPEDKKKMTVFRYDREMLEWDESYSCIPQEQDDWSWGGIADRIDWLILSQYIPDTEASQYTKKIAYVMLDIMRMVLENDIGKNVSTLLVYEMTRARFNHAIANHQLVLSKDCLRQAFKYYAEDELFE